MPTGVNLPSERRVARAMRAGGPEVTEVAREELPALKPGEVLVSVAAAGLNHAETLVRSGNYVVRLPFPYAMGGEGAGSVIASDSETLPAGKRVCWGAVLGSCADYLIAPASMLVPIPDSLTFRECGIAGCCGIDGGRAGARVAARRANGCGVGGGGCGGADAGCDPRESRRYGYWYCERRSRSCGSRCWCDSRHRSFE